MLFITIGIVLTIICVAVMDKIREKREDEMLEQVSQEKPEPYADVHEILDNLGCKTQFDMVDGKHRAFFRYQGEAFVTLLDIERRNIIIADLPWYHFDSSDIDKFAEVRKAVNKINNEYYGMTLFYSKNDEDATIEVTSKYEMFRWNDREWLGRNFENGLNAMINIKREFYSELIKAGVEW